MSSSSSSLKNLFFTTTDTSQVRILLLNVLLQDIFGVFKRTNKLCRTQGSWKGEGGVIVNSCSNKRWGLGDETFSDLSNIMLSTHKGEGGGRGGGAVCPFPGFATAYYSNQVRIDIVKFKELNISSCSRSAQRCKPAKKTSVTAAGCYLFVVLVLLHSASEKQRNWLILTPI